MARKKQYDESELKELGAKALKSLIEEDLKEFDFVSAEKILKHFMDKSPDSDWARDLRYNLRDWKKCEIKKDVLVKYSKDARRAEIPEGIKVIKEKAFENSEIRSLVIPTGVDFIGAFAFLNCKQLEDVKLPYAMHGIGKGAFEGCRRLRKINLPEVGLDKINSYTFNNCQSLTHVLIPQMATSIESNAFANTALIKVTIPHSVTSIGASAFENCENLTRINISDRMKSIGYRAFYKSGLRHANLPKGLELIGEEAFAETNIEGADIPDTVLELGEGVFSLCRNLTEVKLPEGIFEIPRRAFYQCTALAEIKLPQKLRLIGAEAFYNCCSLGTVNSVQGVDVIESKAFYDCSRLFGFKTKNVPMKILIDAFDGSPLEDWNRKEFQPSVEGEMNISLTDMPDIEKKRTELEARDDHKVESVETADQEEAAPKVKTERAEPQIFKGEGQGKEKMSGQDVPEINFKKINLWPIDAHETGDGTIAGGSTSAKAEADAFDLELKRLLGINRKNQDNSETEQTKAGAEIDTEKSQEEVNDKQSEMIPDEKEIGESATMTAQEAQPEKNEKNPEELEEQRRRKHHSEKRTRHKLGEHGFYAKYEEPELDPDNITVIDPAKEEERKITDYFMRLEALGNGIGKPVKNKDPFIETGMDDVKAIQDEFLKAEVDKKKTESEAASKQDTPETAEKSK